MYYKLCNIHRPRTIRQWYIIIGPFTYVTHIAVHCLSYTVHQLLGLATCFVNLKVGGSHPFRAILLSRSNITPCFYQGCFFITPCSCIVFCKTFITKRWLAFIRRTKEFRMPNFLLFDVFRRTLKIPG